MPTVPPRLAYLGVTNAFALLRLLPGGDRDKDIEILSSHHQLAVDRDGNHPALSDTILVREARAAPARRHRGGPGRLPRRPRRAALDRGPWTELRRSARVDVRRDSGHLHRVAGRARVCRAVPVRLWVTARRAGRAAQPRRADIPAQRMVGTPMVGARRVRGVGADHHPRAAGPRGVVIQGHASTSTRYARGAEEADPVQALEPADRERVRPGQLREPDPFKTLLAIRGNVVTCGNLAQAAPWAAKLGHRFSRCSPISVAPRPPRRTFRRAFPQVTGLS